MSNKVASKNIDLGLSPLVWIIIHLHLTIIMCAMLIKAPFDLWLRLSIFIPGVLLLLYSAWIRYRR